MRNNILYLLNHKTLTDFEVPIIIKQGFGVFIPKIYTGLSKGESIAFDSVYSYDNSLINVNETDFKYLCNIEFFNSKDIFNNTTLFDIINFNFKAIFLTLLHVDSIKYISENFKGQIYVRFFGLGGEHSYYHILKDNNINVKQLKNVKYIFSYKEILDFEKSKHNFFNNNNSFYVPLGLPDTIVEKYNNIHNINNINKFVFICSKINLCPYYTNIYNQFNNLFKLNKDNFIILGKDNENIKDIDTRIINNLPDNDYYKTISNCKAMYYHSKEPRHLHYHPLEAIIIGIPIIFHSENLLSTYLYNSPGKCNSDKEVLEKFTRIINNDYNFINSIIEYQNILKEILTSNYNIRTFDMVFKDINKITSMEITPAMGIGDIIIEKLKSNSNNITISKINIPNFIFKKYRNHPEKALKNIINLINFLFDKTEIVINNTITANNQLFNLNIQQYPINRCYIYDEVKNKIPTFIIPYDNYIIFHTKVRLYPLMDQFIKNELHILQNFICSFKTNKKIILCGERNIENNYEKKVLNIISIYQDLLKLKNNNIVIDLTYDELYSGQDDFNNFLYDIELINKADCNINLGVGGSLSLVACFSKYNLIYLSEYLNDPHNTFGQTLKVLKVYTKGNLYSNIYQFINRIDDEYSITPRTYLNNNKIDKSAYFIGHNGLGDNITNSAAIRYLSNFYTKIYFICKNTYLNNVKLLFNDIQNVEIVPIISEDEFNHIKGIYDYIISNLNSDIFVSGFCHKHYIQSKITHPYLIKYNNEYKNSYTIHFNHIKEFYEDINLDLSIYYNFFYIKSCEKSKMLYKSISNYKICLAQSSAGYNNIIDIMNLNVTDNFIIIDINQNYYEKTKEQNLIKYELAQQFINIELVYYIDTILKCDKIYISDSCLACIVYPLYMTNKLLTNDITIIDRQCKQKISF